ncbi:MAG: hypothetical protein SPF30_06900, partial [Arcanobacterium sp.]|nr:hypothetical protein [Arcanobacterium sp.]
MALIESKVPQSKNSPAAVPQDKRSKKSNASAQKRRSNITGWLFSAPALFLLVIFLIIPIIITFGLSVTNARLISPN